jgi:hypothetical protein
MRLEAPPQAPVSHASHATKSRCNGASYYKVFLGSPKAIEITYMHLKEMRDAFLLSKHLGTTRRRPVEMVRSLERYLDTYKRFNCLRLLQRRGRI